MRSDVGILCSTLVCLALSAAAAAPGQSSTPTLSVDLSSGQHPISKEVYGIASYGLDATFAKEIAVPNIRWGGDGTTRYNWQVDSSNAGFDWYFMGGNGVSNPTPGASADLMVRTYQPADALITIPIIPYVNKSSAWNCSFPVSVYGAQQSTNPYVHPNGDNCGNSIAANGTQLIDTNIYANHIDNSTGLEKGWLQHLVGTFGSASQGGVAFYQLDNEPYGWSNTHRDVLPSGADYPTITQLGEQYAAAIKQVDSSAMVLGPSDFTLGGWIGDTTKQNGLLAGQYYLQQMAAYQAQNGVRILDYFDEHYYFNVSSPAAQLASTRTLWDPTYNGGTWVEQYFFNGPMQLIPRFKGWVSHYYPGTKISLSEYSIDSGSKSIVDALAEMDVLGIFGREQLDFANMWSPPAPADPIAYAFRMYRDYDGSGAQYGDTWVSATSSDQSQLSIYAAQRSTDHGVTILVLNKTTASVSTTLALAGATLPATAAVFSYSGANLQQIVPGTAASIANGAITYTFPAYSATLFAFSLAPTPPANTTTTLTPATTTVTAGQSATLTATVSGSGSPGGTVTFTDSGVLIGSATLSANKATLTISTLSAGTHTITATYAGDTADAASTSGAVTVTVTQPPPASTTTSIAASVTQATAGQSVIVAATVSGSGSPAGTITFTDNGASLGSPPLSGGKASLTLSTLSVGSHILTASYSGDPSDAASISTAVTVTVSPPPPAGTTTTLTASASQLTFQQALTVTAQVSSPSGTPAGMVIFSDGTTALGSAPLTNGAATFTDSSLAVGTHNISAAYSGDPTHTASISGAVIVVVAAVPATPAPPALATTTTSLNASAAQLTTAQNLTLTATVASSASPATGNVIFSDGSIKFAVAPVLNGTASAATTLNAGTHTLVAVYSGDKVNASSSSATITVTVTAAATPPPPAPPDFLLQLGQAAMTLAPGASGQVAMTLTPENGFNQQLKLSCSGLPAGVTCSFSPASLAPASTMASSMTITTPSNAAVAGLVLPFVLSLPGALLARRRGRRRFAAFTVGCAVLLLAGCGSGVTSQANATATGATASAVAGTYTIQVTATASGGQIHTQPMTLTLQ